MLCYCYLQFVLDSTDESLYEQHLKKKGCCALFLWGNYRKVEELFQQFSDAVGESLKHAFTGIQGLAEGATKDAVLESVRRSHEFESKADDLRREVINHLVQGSLMPNTRGDMMNLLELIDDIADEAEDLLDPFFVRFLDFNLLSQDGLLDMMREIEQQYKLLIQAVQYLFEDMSNIVDLTHEIEEIESRVDDIEERMLLHVLDNDEIDLPTKMLYRMFVRNLAGLANIIEDSGNQLEVIVAVRSG